MILTDCHTHAPDAKDGVLRVCNVIPSAPEGMLPCRFSAGIHPKSIDSTLLEKDYQRLDTLLDLSGTVGVGECGMDRFASVPMELQEEVFRHQILMAGSRHLPVILHAVRCWPEIIRIRKEYPAGELWVAHGFRSSLEQAFELLDHNILPSFGVYLGKDPRSREVLASLPENGFLLETDESPVSPGAMAELASVIRKCNIECLAESVLNTFKRVFRKS